MRQSVVAVIATYRPDATSLLGLVSDLERDGVALIVVDDASPCTFDTTLRQVTDLGVEVSRHEVNQGIARALNEGLSAGVRAGATWLLTLDQDTRIPTGAIDHLLAFGAKAIDAGLKVGAVGPIMIDGGSGEIRYPTTRVGGFDVTAEIVQSGALWSISGLTSIGGFDEGLGIDAVDAAACLGLRVEGQVILVDAGVRISHRLGSSRPVTFFGRTVLATGHSPARRTTMVRNRLHLARAEFAESPRQGFRSVRRLAVSTALAVTVEDDRWAKAKASAKGLFPRRQR